MNKFLNLLIISIILTILTGLTNDYTYRPISTRQISNKAIISSNFYSITDCQGNKYNIDRGKSESTFFCSEGQREIKIVKYKNLFGIEEERAQIKTISEHDPLPEEIQIKNIKLSVN